MKPERRRPDHFWSLTLTLILILTLTQFPIAATTTQTSWLPTVSNVSSCSPGGQQPDTVSLGRNRSVSEARLFSGGSEEKPCLLLYRGCVIPWLMNPSSPSEPKLLEVRTPSHLTFLWASFQAHTSTSLTQPSRGTHGIRVEPTWVAQGAFPEDPSLLITSGRVPLTKWGSTQAPGIRPWCLGAISLPTTKITGGFW